MNKEIFLPLRLHLRGPFQPFFRRRNSGTLPRLTQTPVATKTIATQKFEWTDSPKIAFAQRAVSKGTRFTKSMTLLVGQFLRAKDQAIKAIIEGPMVE